MTKSSQFSGNFESLRNIRTYEAGITQSSGFRVIKKYTDEALRPYGISTSQWFLLGLVHDSGTTGITITDLSQYLGTNVPFVTNSVNVLLERGLVNRVQDSENGRIKRIFLTPDFESRFDAIEEDLRDHLRETIYSRVTPSELLTYIQVLYKFNNL